MKRKSYVKSKQLTTMRGFVESKAKWYYLGTQATPRKVVEQMTYEAIIKAIKKGSLWTAKEA